MDRAGRGYLEQQALSGFLGLEHDLGMVEVLGPRPTARTPSVAGTRLEVGPPFRSGRQRLDHDPRRQAGSHGGAARDRPPLSVPRHRDERADWTSSGRTFGRFPRAAQVEMHVGRLSAGDMLFIPAGWWHYVASASADYHLSVNCWFGEELPLSSIAKSLLRLGPRTWPDRRRFVVSRAAPSTVRGTLSFASRRGEAVPKLRDRRTSSTARDPRRHP
jgi:hypothetical protein